RCGSPWVSSGYRTGRRGPGTSPSSVAYRPVHELSDQIGVTAVASGLFDHVHDYPPHADLASRRRHGVVQGAGGGDLAGYVAFLPVEADEAVGGVVRIETEVGVGVVVGPREGHLAARPHRLEPVPLDVGEVLDQPAQA